MTTEFAEIDDAVIAEGGVSEGSTDDYNRVWDTLTAACESRENISGLVVDAVKGGLVVDLGVRGFVPKSQVATRNLNSLDNFIGQTVEVKVLEIDREGGRVVLSQRKVVEEARAKMREETLRTLETGQLVDGVVRRITNFGAFVDIGGIDGLLHVSDLAWDHVDDPNEYVKVGQQLKVKVLKIERGGDRISLGLKQLGEDPWLVFRREHREGDIIEVTISGLESFGAITKIVAGVEGVIPNRELAERRVENPEHVVQIGQTVKVKILEMLPRERKLTLSIRGVLREQERQELREYYQRQKEESGPVTLGDLFGDVFSKLQTRDEE